MDDGLTKSFRTFKEQQFKISVEVFNVLNTRLYGGPNTDPTSANFGVVSTSQINFPRQGQLGLRLMF